MFKYVFLVILVFVVIFAPKGDISLTNEMIGTIFVTGIFICLLFFLIFKFGLHYKIQALNGFCISFYYSVFEYKKIQKKPSHIDYLDSVREQAEVALAANFDPGLKQISLKVPASLYTSSSPFLAKLRARIQEAERMKLEARHLESQADKLVEDTKEIMVDKELVAKVSPSSMISLDSIFEVQEGIESIIELTIGEIKGHGYNQTPDYEIITHIALDNNPYFSGVYKYFKAEDVAGVLYRAPFMIILVGIIGTFAGFYLALDEGGDIKSGAAVAIVSSLVGLPVSLFMDYINTLFPDREKYLQAFNKFKISLEILFNHEKELYDIRRDRRRDDRNIS